MIEGGAWMDVEVEEAGETVVATMEGTSEVLWVSAGTTSDVAARATEDVGVDTETLKAG
jgi:hypothetical protein